MLQPFFRSFKRLKILCEFLWPLMTFCCQYYKSYTLSYWISSNHRHKSLILYYFRAFGCCYENRPTVLFTNCAIAQVLLCLTDCNAAERIWTWHCVQTTRRCCWVNKLAIVCTQKCDRFLSRKFLDIISISRGKFTYNCCRITRKISLWLEHASAPRGSCFEGFLHFLWHAAFPLSANLKLTIFQFISSNKQMF
jgi:hypothetical protein